VFVFALTVNVESKVVLVHFMKVYEGVEVQHHAFLTFSGQPHVLAPLTPWSKSLLRINIKTGLKEIVLMMQTDFVRSCVDCNESLVFMNWFILINCHYLIKFCPPCIYYIISKMLICFIFCSKFVEIEKFFISTEPKCLPDIIFYESRGT
jgi:hypothetical protein